jgi:polyphosphate kinase
MDRNLDRRVEALLRVKDPHALGTLDSMLELAWTDDVDHWSLRANGDWERAPRTTSTVEYQRELIARRRKAHSSAEAEES